MPPNKRKSNKKMIFDFDIFGFLRALINSQKLAKIKKAVKSMFYHFGFLDSINLDYSLKNEKVFVCIDFFS